MKKNDVIELAVTSLSHEGDGVGRYEGMAVFVPMTAVGDIIEAKVVKVLKNHAFAIINNIITPSAHRVENDCPVYRRCGGCSLRHIGYENETDIKSGWVSENLRRIGKVAIRLDKPLPSPACERYRNKAQYPVRRIGGKISAGFFAKRSHELVPVGDCLLQPAFFSVIVREVISFLEKYSLEPYDEQTGGGLLRHIFIRYGEASGEAMLCLIINAEELPHFRELAKALEQSCPMVKTIVININRDNTNVIFGAKTRVLTGSGYITDKLCDIRVRLSAESFYQVNREAAEQLYRTALEYAAPNQTDVLLDLYCGTGTIGLSMAHAVGEVIGVEIIASAARDARHTAAQNNITNARFIHADAGAAAERLKREGIHPDIVVVDPPRKGLDEKLPALIAQLAPDKLVYISCNSATLARDVQRLEPLGYKLARAASVDLFPRTAHVECVALMIRIGGHTMIRTAQISELDTIMDIVGRARELMQKQNNFQWDDKYPVREHFEQDIRDGVLFVLEHDGAIAGFACINDDVPPEYAGVNWENSGAAMVIHRMAVSPEFRGLGLAGKLFDFAWEHAKSARFASLKSDTFSGNIAMNSLFIKHGFKKTGEIELTGRRQQPFFCYEKTAGQE